MGKCLNPNPGCSLNAPCLRSKGHEGNHSNGFSEWTNKAATGGNTGR